MPILEPPDSTFGSGRFVTRLPTALGNDILRLRSELGLQGGVVIANPVPEAHAIEFAELERWIERAHAEAADEGVSGAALTPFLLDALADLSEGRTVAANAALVESNAALAARIAVALAATD